MAGQQGLGGTGLARAILACGNGIEWIIAWSTWYWAHLWFDSVPEFDSGGFDIVLDIVLQGKYRAGSGIHLVNGPAFTVGTSGPPQVHPGRWDGIAVSISISHPAVGQEIHSARHQFQILSATVPTTLLNGQVLPRFWDFQTGERVTRRCSRYDTSLSLRRLPIPVAF